MLKFIKLKSKIILVNYTAFLEIKNQFFFFLVSLCNKFTTLVMTTILVYGLFYTINNF